MAVHGWSASSVNMVSCPSGTGNRKKLRFPKCRGESNRCVVLGIIDFLVITGACST